MIYYQSFIYIKQCYINHSNLIGASGGIGIRASGTCLKTEALRRMSEKGDTLFEDVKSLIEQKMEPFHQDIIGITETFNYLKAQDKEISRQNELAEVLTKLEGVRLGECKHLLTGKTPVLWRIRNHEKYKKKTNTDIASDFWVPMDYKKWDMEKKDVDRVKLLVQDMIKTREISTFEI